MAVPAVWELIARGLFKLILVLGRPDLADRFGWELNTNAEPLVAWYGPLGLLLLVVGSGMVVVLAFQRRLGRLLRRARWRPSPSLARWRSFSPTT